jgi:hypothetical protein
VARVRRISSSRGKSREAGRDELLLIRSVLGQRLAKLYDEGGSEQERLAKAKEIDTKYSAGYQALFNQLVELGKAYAAKHHIKVEWQTRNF